MALAFSEMLPTRCLCPIIEVWFPILLCLIISVLFCKNKPFSFLRRPASRFLCGAITQKLVVNFFKILKVIFLAAWGCASDFLKMLQNSKWTPEVNSKFCCGHKLFKFYYHIPHDIEICRWFFQGFTEIQNGRHGSTLIFWWARKLKILKSEII